jgi:hypothetical protein
VTTRRQNDNLAPSLPATIGPGQSDWIVICASAAKGLWMPSPVAGDDILVWSSWQIATLQSGPGGTSQLSRAFRARFGMPPRQYLALVRQQDLDWHEARLITDGFDRDAFLWRQQRLGASAAHGTWHAPVSKQSGGAD